MHRNPFFCRREPAKKAATTPETRLDEERTPQKKTTKPPISEDKKAMDGPNKMPSAGANIAANVMKPFEPTIWNKGIRHEIVYKLERQTVKAICFEVIECCFTLVMMDA